MSPAEDAALLLAIVRRHLRSLRIGLEAAYPEEDWGFIAQQAMEKPLKAWLVLADRRPPRLHHLKELASLAEQPLDGRLAALQVFAVEARYEEGPFPLPASREELLALLESELERCERAVSWCFMRTGI
ncbi:MAG: HEPN domain-containing protein [Cyanobacteria bacterium]|nr:HEPN domain-containing protein [Cyanobacteriota bacterium]